jgi:Ni,Fe-hydrogenase I cytochrome b subunit
MAATTYLEAGTIQEASRPDTARFSALVRVTHWLNTISFVALVVSGF